ncbi:protein LMBR1L-like [Ostrea edulis]|uniref:protein LMBR1L-like n=1 Tax=Ostrea edulis TaxID=37623 RepID=UPI002095AF11|nr:protein LMBR1L-like [Ostrea edulis]
MSEDVDVDIREQVFHNAVREYIICLLLFIFLYVSSYVTVRHFKTADSEDISSAGEEDAVVYRIALWMCTFTLSVSVGAILLLPVSIVSNEVLLLYPNSYYVQWLNSSLIIGFWNNIFLISNLSLFFFMPFAYFFTESEGFVGLKKGIWSRVYEAFILLVLVGILMVGLAWVASAIFDGNKHSQETLFDIWSYYLPYLYSCISFLGVIILMLCTPVGFSRMFTVMGELIVKPKFFQDVENELVIVRLTETELRRRLTFTKDNKYKQVPDRLANGHLSTEDLIEQLENNQKTLKELEKRSKTSIFWRNLCYPLVMLLLLALTVLCVLMVAHNFLLLLVGIKALPVGAKETVLGMASLSALGSFGAALEIVLILYVMLASVLGFYSLPFFRSLRPVPHETPMVKVIGNCIVLLILSSALPIMSRTLGLTNFDLIGNFGSMDWLGNFYIIMLCNIVFAGLTTLCLVTKFTKAVRTEIYDRLMAFFISEQGTQGRTHSFLANGEIGSKED